MFQFRPRLEEHRTPASNFSPQQPNRIVSGNQGQQNLLPPPNLPRQRIDTEKDNQRLQQSAENLSSLHSKLHDEAERIRYWKKSTELEIKQKDKKLDDAMQTIDSLRKSILELQFQNENISTKLQETKSSHQETVQRITTTRDMCNALKEHVVKIEENIVRGEADKDNLRFLEKERIDQIQDLVLKFQDIEIGCAAKNDQTRNKIAEMQQKFERESNTLTEEVSSSQGKIATLEDMRKTQDKIITSLKDDIDDLKEQVNNASQATATLSQKLTEAENNNRRMEDDLSKKCVREEEQLLTITDLKHRNENISEAKIQLEAELRRQQKALSEIKDESELKIKELSEQINELQRSLLDEKSRYGETCENLNSKKNELESLQSLLKRNEQEHKRILGDCSASKQETVILQEKINDLSEKLRMKTEELKSVKKDRSAADALRCKTETNNKSLTKKFEKMKEESECLKKTIDEIESENNKLKIEVSDLNESLREEESKVKLHESEIKATRKENSMIQKKVNELTKKLDISAVAALENRKELEVLKLFKEDAEVKLGDIENENVKLKDKCKKLELENKEFENTIAELNTNLEELRSSIEQVNGTEKAKAESLNKTVAAKKKRIENLENKLKGLQADLTEKKKCIKDGQQEIKSLASELKDEQTLTDKVSKDLACLQREHENLKEETEKLKVDCHNNEEKAMAAKKETDYYQSELQKGKIEFEMQIKELCATLEMYKTDNEKVVETKDREITQIKEQLGKSESAAVEICQLQTLVTTLKNEVKETKLKSKEQLTLKESTIKNLEEKLRKESGELASIRVELSKLQDSQHQKQDNFQDNRALTTPKLTKKVTFANRDSQSPISHNVIIEEQRAPNTENKTPKSGRNSNVRLTPRLSREPNSTSVDTRVPPAEPQKPILKLVGKKIANDEKPKRADEVNTQKLYLSEDIKSCQKNERVSKVKSKQSLEDVNRMKRIERKPRETTGLDEEMEQFRELFPDRKALELKSKPSKQLSTPRKAAPFKGRVKKLTPKLKQKEDTSWFDSDSVFGFGDV